MRRPGKELAGYALLLGLSLLAATVAGYTPFGRQIDCAAYDWMFRLHQSEPWQPESAVLAIDDDSLKELGGVRGLRALMAAALERLASVSPKAVVVDLTLTDVGDPREDERLEAAMRATPKLVLASEMLPGGEGWQDPLPRFQKWAAAIGHVHAAPGEYDGVAREVPLEKVTADHRRRWALSLEAFRLSRGVNRILESPEDLQVGSTLIPAKRSDARAIYIRFLAARPDGSTAIPRVSVKRLLAEPSAAGQLQGKVVFIGVTAESAARDRLMTPVSTARPMPGVEIHANAFETLAQGHFLTSASDLEVAGVDVLMVALAGAIFLLFSGWTAYALGGALLAAGCALPYLLFNRGVVFPVTSPSAAVWLAVAGAASYQHFVARRQLRRAEAEKSRYQQAVQFVTHEMRTPLTAIQGSSELMSRYNLSEEKRKQITNLIHSESQRLARMIETFLNVERLTAGQMELKREPVPAATLAITCLERAQPLADRKQIRLRREALEDVTLMGDRELLEYAFYNLVTNAIKYSPPETEVSISGHRDGEDFWLSVRDQGIGMDKKELANIFQKFYRTRKAIASGEAGTGIGLSIVEQIVAQHGGRIVATSSPGMGSCFTLVFPAMAVARAGT
jgi:signal transduction histidine kinase